MAGRFVNHIENSFAQRISYILCFDVDRLFFVGKALFILFIPLQYLRSRKPTYWMFMNKVCSVLIIRVVAIASRIRIIHLYTCLHAKPKCFTCFSSVSMWTTVYGFSFKNLWSKYLHQSSNWINKLNQTNGPVARITSNCTTESDIHLLARVYWCDYFQPFLRNNGNFNERS